MIVIRPRNYRPPVGAESAAAPPENPPAAENLPVPAPAAEAPSPPADVASSAPVADAAPVLEPSPILSPASSPVPFSDHAPAPDLPAITAKLQEALGPRFDVLHPVAIGGMGTLVQLRSKALSGLFLAKVLHAQFVEDAGIRAAFRREARHVARLSGHPAIVPVFELLEEPAFACMLMPYLEGEDLDQILKRQGKLERDEALMLVGQLASLLMYGETLGVTHCDLATGNIRLDGFGQYRLLDFGLSCSASPAEATSADQAVTLSGTPAYNSPEQIRGEALDIRSDLYSLGVILVEVLTGRPLFEAPTLEELAQKHLAGDWVMPPELEADPALSKLVVKLLQVDRNQRMSSAFELAGAITALGFELPSFGKALERPWPLPPRPRRRRLEAVETS